jgi:3-hydroxyisobutyrate dehydrogenase
MPAAAMSEERPIVAFLGTGIMGLPMARNLAADGFSVRAWNRTREKAEPLEADGCAVCDSAEAAVDGAGVVVTMLADAEAVQDAMTGAGGGLAAAREGAVWLQMSTVGVAATERLAEAARDRRVAFVDAPVLGTKAPAEQAELLVLASGPAEALARCRPIFAAVGKRTLEVGPAGAGTRLKLVINNWLLGIVENLSETIAFAQGIGVEPELFLEAIDGGPVGVPYAQLKGKAMMSEEFAPSFKLDLALKDVELVREAAKLHDVELPLADVVAEQFARAVELGHGEEDMAAAYYASAPDAR